MKWNNNFPAPRPAVPASQVPGLWGQLRWPTSYVKNYLLLVPIPIPKLSDF